MISLFPSRAVALSIGVLQIHWYGIMYALAFIFGMLLLPGLQRLTRLSLTEQQRESLVLAMFLGVLIGGRLGFVLFYGGDYFLMHPLKIFAVWEGGMASHGGFIGVALGMYLFVRKTGAGFFRLTDTVLIPVAIGLALGRLGNFINGELYGTVTALPWGMHFPGAEGLRHPTQIYAIIKDLTLAVCSFLIIRRCYASEPAQTGVPTASFLILYAVFRFTVEIFRDQPYGYTDLLGLSLSRGQLLTLPLLLAGVVLLILRRRKAS